jgi:hypothetical protein
MIGGKRGSALSRHHSHRDAMPSPGGVEFAGILRLILDRVNLPCRLYLAHNEISSNGY